MNEMKKSAFVGIELVRSISSLTQCAENCKRNFPFVVFSNKSTTACGGQTRPVFSSKNNFLSIYPLVLIGGSLSPMLEANAETCVPVLRLKSQAAENECLQVSHALDDDTRGKTHPQLKRHVTLTQYLLVILFLCSS